MDFFCIATLQIEHEVGQTPEDVVSEEGSGDRSLRSNPQDLLQGVAKRPKIRTAVLRVAAENLPYPAKPTRCGGSCDPAIKTLRGRSDRGQVHSPAGSF